MKLNEVLEPKYSYHKIKSNPDDVIRNLGTESHEDVPPKSKLLTVLGKGAYSTVLQRQGSPNVIKFTRGVHSLQNDPHFQYISAIAENPQNFNNPYFPRFYKVKVYETTDPNRKYMYFVEMEKLIPTSDLTADQLREVVKAVVRPSIKTKIETKFFGVDLDEKLAVIPKGELRRILENALWHRATIDPQLKAAFKLIRTLGGKNDLTLKNAMVRFENGKPQIVITDPLAPDQ